MSSCYHWALGLILFWDTGGDHEWKESSRSQGEHRERVKLIILWWYIIPSLDSLGPQSHTRGLWSLGMYIMPSRPNMALELIIKVRKFKNLERDEEGNIIMLE